VSDLEQAASCLVKEADAAAPAAAPLPCLNRNNCTILPPSARKTAWLLEESVKRFIKRFGLENVGFLTLTFAEHIVDPKEAQKRWHSLKTHVLNKHYNGRWMRVIERQKSKRIHYHVLVAVGDDIRTGADFAAFARRDYRSANPNLRREWAYWRTISPKYRFGRTEIMPIYKTEEAVAKYVGKYIAKHIEKRLAIDKGMRMVEYGRGCRIGTTKFQFNTPGAWLWRQKLRRFARQVSPERDINMEGLARRLGRGNWLFKHFGRIMSIDLQGVAFPTQYLWILHETVQGRIKPENSHLAKLCELDAQPDTMYTWPGSQNSLEKAVELFWSKVHQLRYVNRGEPHLVPRWNGGPIPADRVPNPDDPF
jgi:hypothetical protein